jgi:hypothetical protein
MLLIKQKLVPMQGYFNQQAIRLQSMKVQDIPITDVVPYDSREAKQEYHLARIRLLEEELEKLNLLEHPCEILCICKQIIAIKEVLQKLTSVAK